MVISMHFKLSCGLGPENGQSWVKDEHLEGVRDVDKEYEKLLFSYSPFVHITSCKMYFLEELSLATSEF